LKNAKHGNDLTTASGLKEFHQPTVYT